MARRRARDQFARESGVTTIEWVALAGAVAIGGVAAFWWAQSQTGGFQPTANTIQGQVDSASTASFGSE